MSHTNAGLRSLDWRKARRSIGNGDCVEIAPVNGKIAFRDSKDPEGPTLSYPLGVFLSFLDAAKKGDVLRLAAGREACVPAK